MIQQYVFGSLTFPLQTYVDNACTIWEKTSDKYLEALLKTNLHGFCRLNDWSQLYTETGSKACDVKLQGRSDFWKEKTCYHPEEKLLCVFLLSALRAVVITVFKVLLFVEGHISYLARGRRTWIYFIAKTIWLKCKLWYYCHILALWRLLRWKGNRIMGVASTCHAAATDL